MAESTIKIKDCKSGNASNCLEGLREGCHPAEGGQKGRILPERRSRALPYSCFQKHPEPQPAASQLFGKLPVHERDFRTRYRDSPVNPKDSRAAGSQPRVTSATARTHLPNRQELRLSGKCAPSSPLRLMVTRRAEDAMVRPAVSPEPATATEGGAASRRSSPSRRRAAPQLIQSEKVSSSRRSAGAARVRALGSSAAEVRPRPPAAFAPPRPALPPPATRVPAARRPPPARPVPSVL